MSNDGSTVLIPESTKKYTPWQVLKEEGLLRDGETDPSKYKAASQNNDNTPTAPEPLFDVESVVSNVNQDIFMQKARDAANQLEAIFVNIPGFKVRSTERGGVIITYNNKRVEVPAGIIYNTTDNEKKQAIAKSKAKKDQKKMLAENKATEATTTSASGISEGLDPQTGKTNLLAT